MMNKKHKLIIGIAILILLFVFISYNLYWFDISNIFFLQENFIIRYTIFNMVFLFNVLCLMIKKIAKFWYVIYLIQLTMFFSFYEEFFSINNSVDIVFMIVLVYCLLLFGSLFSDSFSNFMKNRYQNGLVRQNNFYRKTAKKYKILNNIAFFRTVVGTNLGSWEIPNAPSFFFWLGYTVFLFFVGYLAFNCCFRFIFSMAFFCLVMSSFYETIYYNYRDSTEFKKSFDVNVRFWTIKLNKKKMSDSPNLIKRNFSQFAREKIIIASDKLGSVSMVNLKFRTLVVLGKGLFVVGGMTVGGYLGGKYIEQNGATERHKISMDHDLEKEKIRQEHDLEREKIRQEHKTERARIVAESNKKRWWW